MQLQSGSTSPAITQRHLPGSGIWIVFTRQLRARCAVRDLIWMVILVACQHSLAVGLQFALVPMQEYNAHSALLAQRELTTACVTGTLLYMPLAAVLGALACPSESRFEETQSLLLTRLTAVDLCVGRLLAWMWPVISAILASCALSLMIQVGWRPILPSSVYGYLSIGMMHIVLLTAALCFSAIALLFAIRRRPGRAPARGLFAGVAAATLAIGGLFLANSIIPRMDNPAGLINSLLLINPAVAASTSLHVDVLRLNWVYDHTESTAYPFMYPNPVASCSLFMGISLGATGLAAIRLRNAYR